MTPIRALDLDSRLDEYDTQEQIQLLKQLSLAAVYDVNERMRIRVSASLRTTRMKPNLRSNAETTMTRLLGRYSAAAEDEHDTLFGGHVERLVHEYRNVTLIDIIGDMRVSLLRSQAVQAYKSIIDRTFAGITNTHE